MKKLKKGLSLLAVAAFLTFALIPAASMAADPPLPVLSTNVSVTAGSAAAIGSADAEEQYAALPTASAVIMPGQELQLQLTGNLPAAAPSDPPTRTGWYYGSSVGAAAAQASAVTSEQTLPSPGAAAPSLTIKGAAPASDAPSEGGSAEEGQTGDGEQTAADSTVEVQAGTTRAYAYVAGPYAPQSDSTSSTWWGGGFSVQCVQPALDWSGLYSSFAPTASEEPATNVVAGQTRYATVTWKGALPPMSAGSTTGNPAVTVSAKDADGNGARGITCNLPQGAPANSARIEVVTAYNVPGGEYTIEVVPQATVPDSIRSIALAQKINVLGYALQSEAGGTTGTVGQRATSVVRWEAANSTTSAGVPANPERLVYRWTAEQTPAPTFSNGVYDAATGTITAQTTEPLTSLTGPLQYTVQAYLPAAQGGSEQPVGQPVRVTLGSLSNYTLQPVASEQNGVTVAAGSIGSSSVAWATGGTAQTPTDPSALTYVWTATGSNAASAPALTAIKTPVSGAAATAQTASVLTLSQAGTYTYSVQAYDGTGDARTAVGNPASVTMNVVVPQLVGDPEILRATVQTAPDKLLRARWADNAVPTDEAWLANVQYTWTPQTEDPSTWPVVDVTTSQPSNALRSNFVGGNPNVYAWSVEAVYTDPTTGRKTSVGNPVLLQLDLYSENVLVAAYETGKAFTATVGEKAAMSVVWANGFAKTGETYTWTAPEGAPAIEPASTAAEVTTAPATLEQGGKTYTYTVQPYTQSGAPDGDAAKVDLRIQPYLLKPEQASQTIKTGETATLEAAWSAEDGSAVPAENAQLTYTWGGPEPEGGPAVTGDGLTASVAAATEAGEWTYTLTAQSGSGTDAITIATAQFTVTVIEDTSPVVPSLEPLENSDVSISTSDDVKYIEGAGLTATAAGHTVSAVIGMMTAPPEGYAIQITSPDGRTVKGEDEIVGTGDLMQLVRVIDGEDDEAIEQAVSVVMGDVMGTGKMSLTQLVRLAGAFTGSLTLDGANLMAADLDGNGGINLTDLVREAALYKSEVMNAPDDSGNEPAPSTSPEASQEPAASDEPTTEPSASPDASAEPSGDAGR